MTRILAAMIATNAAELLPLSLGSVRDSVDEIVVVDGGSMDNSVFLAKSMGATVIESPWPGRHSLQRQVYLDYAISRATADEDVWMLVLDSDEVVTPGDLRATIQRLNDVGVAYAKLRRMWLVETPHGLRYVASRPHYPDWQARLFKVHCSLRYVGTVHEKLLGLARGQKLDEPVLLHLDLLRNDAAARQRKVTLYDRQDPGSGLPRFYLFERFGYALREVPQKLAIGNYESSIRSITRFRLQAGHLLAKRIQYQATWRLAILVQWTAVKFARWRFRSLGRVDDISPSDR